MRWQKGTILLFLTSLLCAVQVFSQSRPYSHKRNLSATRSRPNKASIVCPIFDERAYPYQGIGLKLGDPFALTYKFYATRNLAFALDAGKTASGLYNKYYQNVFDTYIPETLTADQTMQHLSHKVTKDFFLEMKALYQWDVESLSKGLQFYAGAGWQWRNANINYDYILEDNTSGGTISTLGQMTQQRFTYGPVGVIGFEYAYFNIPIAAFIEVEWFYDVALDPGYSRFQGGVGLRYVFK